MKNVSLENSYEPHEGCEIQCAFNVRYLAS